MKLKSLNHVALKVSDVEESVKFYRDVLGFEQLDRPAFDFPGAWFALGGPDELHLIGERGDGEVVVSAPRGNHYAIEVEDIKAVEGHLNGQGVEMLGPKRRPDGIWQIFIQDPDGHWIEFTQLG